MKYKDQKVISYFPAENVAGMYLIIDIEQSPILVSFDEFAELVKESKEKE